MLKRKIEARLKEWKSEGNHKPLVIKGVRQCGKTFIAEKFARENYGNLAHEGCETHQAGLFLSRVVTIVTFPGCLRLYGCESTKFFVILREPLA